MNNDTIDGVVSIKIRGFDTIQGIVLSKGTQWTLIKYIPNDFLVDGIAFINNKYLVGMTKTENDHFKEKVLKLKNIDFSTAFGYNLQEDEPLFSELMLEKGLIQIYLQDKDRSYIGNILKVSNKSFRYRMLSIKAIWLKDYPINYSSVRMIHVNNDYLKSLTLLLELDKSS
jgi:hypothetical protein